MNAQPSATPSVDENRFSRFFGYTRIHICEHERGVLWVDGECTRLLEQGTRWFFDPLKKIRITIYNRRQPWLSNGFDEHMGDREVILGSGVADAELDRLVLNDGQLAVARVDGRYAALLGPGVHAWWKGLSKVEVTVRDIAEEIRGNNGRIDPAEAALLASDPEAQSYFTLASVPANTEVAMFRSGKLMEFLSPGRHAFWNGADEIELRYIDTREQTVDIGGQELLTSDRLPLRLNAVLSYCVSKPEKSLGAADLRQALYREAQLVLRAQVGVRSLEEVLSDRESLSSGMGEELGGKVAGYGVSVVSFGVRDVILPGDVKGLLLKAAEARASSEAATILRREETAAMRHQLNTARLLSENPMLLRLRELEAVERVADGGKLTVVVGEKGLTEHVAEMM